MQEVERRDIQLGGFLRQCGEKLGFFPHFWDLVEEDDQLGAFSASWSWQDFTPVSGS